MGFDVEAWREDARVAMNGLLASERNEPYSSTKMLVVAAFNIADAMAEEALVRTNQRERKND